jgi:5-methylcytosine-specific restriction endonuclease McrA
MSLKHITVEQLAAAAKESYSAAEAARKLGIVDFGNTLTRIRKKIFDNNIDISHWTGQLWSKGKTALDDTRIRNTEDIFVEDSKATPHYVRTLILKKNLLDYCCVSCDNDGTWLGKKINLELDHVNGNSKDNRLSNLRWLCPNCHSQTETYCGKNINKGVKVVADEIILEHIKNGLNNRQILVTIGLAPKAGNYKRINRLRDMDRKH